MTANRQTDRGRVTEIRHGHPVARGIARNGSVSRAPRSGTRHEEFCDKESTMMALKNIIARSET